MTTTRTACSYCGVGCGIEVTTTTDSGVPVIARVSGDRLHPANFGRLCTKGATHAEMMAAVDGRLTSALVRPSRHEEPLPTPVDDAVAEAGTRLRAIVDEHGPDAVALYVSGQMSIEAQYLANKLAKGFLRTIHIESNSRLCMASAGTGYKQSLGADGPPGSYDDFDCTDLFFVIGSNMADCHPILFLRMVDRLKAGAKLIVVDPRRTATAERADLFLQIKPGTDLALLNGLLHLLVENGDIDNDFIAEHTDGWDDMPDVPCRLSAGPGRRHHRHSRRPTSAPRPHDRRSGGMDDAVDDGAEPEHARHLEHQRDLQPAPGHRGDLPARQRPDVADRPAQRDGRPRNGLHGAGTARAALGDVGGRPRVRREAVGPAVRNHPRPTSVPARLRCSRGLHVVTIKACWIICTNPVATVANRQTVIAGLEAAELVITQDAYQATATNKYADIVLPAALWAESDAVMVNSERNLTLLQASVRPAGQSRPDWQLICEVADAHGLRRALRLLLQRGGFR